MRLDEGAAAVRVREPRCAREGARVDAQRHGQGRHRSEGRRRAHFRESRPHGRERHSRQSVSTHADKRCVLGQGRPVLPAACWSRSARTAAPGRGGALERARRRADRQEQHHHACVERPHDKLRPDRPSCRRDAASASGDDHDQVAGPMDADGHRAEEPRRAAQGDRQDGLRDRRSHARHEMGGRESVPRVWRRRQVVRLRSDSQHAWRAIRRAVPDSGSSADPRSRFQRRRRGDRRHLVPGQDRARSDADRVDDSPRARRVQHGEHARDSAGRARSARPRARQSRRCRRGLRASRQDRRGDVLDAVSAARSHGAWQRDGARHERSRGHLDR